MMMLMLMLIIMTWKRRKRKNERKVPRTYVSKKYFKLKIFMFLSVGI